jgi:hypothetical protein
MKTAIDSAQTRPTSAISTESLHPERGAKGATAHSENCQDAYANSYKAYTGVGASAGADIGGVFEDGPSSQETPSTDARYRLPLILRR